ncbi:MAG: DUF362 domain-containing protein [Chloroflexota bacterium]
MSDEIYRKLAQYLDSLPPGFPPTESGVELRILKRLFTPEEAALALHLTLLGEEPKVVALRVHRPVDEVAEQLEQMASKGLIYRISRRSKPPLYQIIYFVLGIWEFQLNRLNEGLVQDVDEYMAYVIEHGFWKTSPQLRTIPVMESIPVEHGILAYDQAETVVRSRREILLAPCICRREKELQGESCGKPLETCLLFDTAARFYHKNGLGRMISADEAMDVLHLAAQTGLVIQPTNSQDPVGLCCCCGDCCGALRNLNRLEKPAEQVVSAYQAYHDPELCAACGTCVLRCQMDAMVETDGVYSLNLDRCIGCGLCVLTCSTGALTLAPKPVEERPRIPRNEFYTALQMWQDRGRLDVPEMAMMVVKSKLDRLRASLS